MLWCRRTGELPSLAEPVELLRLWCCAGIGERLRRCCGRCVRLLLHLPASGVRLRMIPLLRRGGARLRYTLLLRGHGHGKAVRLRRGRSLSLIHI